MGFYFWTFDMVVSRLLLGPLSRETYVYSIAQHERSQFGLVWSGPCFCPGGSKAANRCERVHKESLLYSTIEWHGFFAQRMHTPLLNLLLYVRLRLTVLPSPFPSVLGTKELGSDKKGEMGMSLYARLTSR